MKFYAALSILALGLAQAEKLENTFERALVVDEKGRGLDSCCEWVCEEPDPDSYYRSMAMMKSGSGSGRSTKSGSGSGPSMKSGSGSGPSIKSGSYDYDYRRTQEDMAEEQNVRKLPYVHDPVCSWDCSACEDDTCLPIETLNEDCECECCGNLPDPIEPEYVYRSKGMMGYSRRALSGKGYGMGYPGKGYDWGFDGYFKGPGISCECSCDPPAPRSKAMMMASGSYGYDY